MRSVIVATKVTEIHPFEQAYQDMASVGYRPAVAEPEYVDLTTEEVVEYVQGRLDEDAGAQFKIDGCTDFATGREFILLIEAAQLLCRGDEGRDMALRLIDMARSGLKG